MRTTPPSTHDADHRDGVRIRSTVTSIVTVLRARWQLLVVTLIVLLTQLYAFVWAGVSQVVANPDVQLHYWTIWWWAHALWVNPLGVWDAPQFVPYTYTLAYSDHLAALGILVAPLVWLQLPIAGILNGVMLASALATIWAMYALVRAEGASAWPAVLVVLAVTFGAFRSTHLVHLQMQMTWMLPVAVLWLRWALHAPRLWSWAFGGLLLVVGASFSVSSYHALMLVPVLALVAGATWLATPPAMRMQMAWRVVIVAACSAVVLVPAVWPYIQAQQMTGISRTLTEQTNWSAPLQSWIAVSAVHPVWPRLFGDAVVGRPELVLAPGLVLSIGAIVALRRLPRTQVVWLVVVALGFVLASGTALRVRDGDAGIALPFAEWLMRLPGYSALRVPARWGWLVVFGMAILAATGWSRLVATQPRWLVLVVGCLALDLSWPQVPFTPAPQPTTVPAVVNWMATQPPAHIILELPLKPQIQSDIQADRLWWQTIHQQRSVTGYSGLIPATQVLLARNAAHLPRADVLARIQAMGVAWVVVYRGTAEGDALATAMQGCATCRLLYDRSDAVVYALPPSGLFATQLPAGAHVWVSGDTRLNDLVAMGAVHGFRARDMQVSAPARPRFYLEHVLPNTLPDAWVLSANEEPESVGVTALDGIAADADAVVYARPAGLIAAQSVVAPQGQLVLTYRDDGVVLLDGQPVATATTPQVTVVCDVAVLAPQRIATRQYAPGAHLVEVVLAQGAASTLAWDVKTANVVRLRVFTQQVTLPALRSHPFLATADVRDDALHIPVWQGEILVRGIEAGTGRAVSHELAAGTPLIAPDQLPELLDGQYQVVLVSAHGQHIVLANLRIDNQRWQWQVVPAQVMLVY